MPAARPLRTVLKVGAGVAGLLLFILALELLKKGVRGLGEPLTDALSVDTPWSALGFGWLFAYVVLSGSPVAAIALTFFESGLFDALEAFSMIAGSRLGASFVVLLVGFLYVLRGKAKGRSLEMGVLSLLTTYSVYAVAVPVGAMVLVSHALDGFRPALPTSVFDFIDVAYSPLVDTAERFLPAPALFVGGVLVLLLAFHLFDRALPDVSGNPLGDLETHVFRPSLMFLIGAGITLVTLSVSVSLSLLVPLSAKGIARRENVVPYIMGANITTFVDTLIATLLLDAPNAFTIVLVEMLSVAAVSIIILVFFFDAYERLVLALARRILATRIRLAAFILVITLAPLALLML